MTSYIVVFGLIVVVVLVVVLVALGLRASRAGRDDDDWMDDEPKQPRGRRGVPPPEEMGGPDEYGGGYGDGYDTGYDTGYDRHGAPEPASAPDRRVAGGPLAAPTSAPAPPRPSAPASDEMEDDDYWATITFDKPRFPWQHDEDGERPGIDPAADPLNAQAQDQPPVDQPPFDQPGPPHPNLTQPALTQPVSMSADGQPLGMDGQPLGMGNGTGPQQMPAPGGYQGASPFAGHDPGSTAMDPIPTDLGQGMSGGQPSYGGPGVPDQQVYGGQEPQPAYGAADYGTGEPSYGGGQDQGYTDQPQYGSHEPSYGEYSADPLGGRPAAVPPPAGRPDGFGPPSTGPGGPLGGDPRVSDPLGLPLGGRSDEPAVPPPPAPPAPPAPAAPAPAAAAAHAGGGSDTDGHKLPTVDELLQRIQNDRQRTAGPPASDAGGYGGSSLNDPLGDPLGAGSFGASGSPAPGGAGSTGNTGPWPSPGQPSGGYDPGAGSGLPSGSGYDQGLGAPGYPTSPAYGETASSSGYGESPRYDDPLSGGRDSFGGTYGGGAEGGPAAGSGGAGGVYGDFSGSSYNGGSDPLAAPHDQGAPGGGQGGYADPNATQAYGTGGYSGGYQQGGYQQGQPNDNSQYGSRQPADDWENYRR